MDLQFSKLANFDLKLNFRWWRDLDFLKKLPYIRERVVELYFWILVGVSYEPNFSTGRIFLSKIICLVTLVDDTFDAYGTFEELTIFTEAVARFKTMHIYMLRKAFHRLSMFQNVHINRINGFFIFRWDIGYIDALPEYMKFIFKTLIGVYSEAEEELSKEGRSYSIQYAIRSVGNFISFDLAF